MLDEALKKVAVVGAAGKMGRGIALLLLQEIARSEAEKAGEVGLGSHCLILIDSDEQRLFSLHRYLRSNLTKYAEKNINLLRQYYAKNPCLISNEEVIDAFVNGALDNVRLDSELRNAADALLVFEAVIEDIELKSTLLNTLNNTRRVDQFYFTNTSSIPISVLNEQCQLGESIIGFHFYNPPPVQKLVEVIAPSWTTPEMRSLASELAKRLNKTVVPAHDIAGFIGNGHFIRELIFACNKARELMQAHKLSLPKAIFLLNRVTQDFLIRSMGIFQVADYVGLDVCRNIAKIMSTYLPDPMLTDELIDSMVEASAIGGQNPDGSQRNGFFQYQNHAIVGVFSLDESRYIPLNDGKWQAESDRLLGATPQGMPSRKTIEKERNREELLNHYFQNLFSMNTLGAVLAKTYLQESQRIANLLVQNGVADSIEDVDTVLQLGFFHLYGVGKLPIPQTAKRS